MKRNIMFSVVILSLLFLLFGCGTADNENNVNNNNNENEVTEENNVNDDNETANEEEQEDPPLVATTVALVEILDALEIDLVGIPTRSEERRVGKESRYKIRKENEEKKKRRVDTARVRQ